MKTLAAIVRRCFSGGEDEARRRAEEQLRLSEERLRLATETGKVGLWDWDIPADRVTWTGGLYAIHGIQAGEFGGTSEDLSALAHPDDREVVREGMRKAIHEGNRYEAEFRAVRPSGEVVWVYVNARILREDGRAMRMVGATFDIDARKRTELALRDSERRLRLALQAANAGVWQLDAVTGETFWSDEFRALYGYDDSTPPTLEAWATRLHPEDRQRMLADFVGRLRPGANEFRREFRIVHPTLGVRWILAMGYVERDAQGRTRTMSGITIDITRLKQVEHELREADERKNEFLATLAHELRNPLTPIRNGLEILRITQGSGELAERARGMMERQLQQMVRLIDDLLEVSRISRGKIELKREPIDLKAALLSAVEVSTPLIEVCGHELALQIPADPVLVHGDLTRLAQVFGNLLNNAAKYTNPGGRIELKVRSEAEQVEVSIRDNGIGIEPSMLPKVFEIFAQADHSLQRARGGLGIGLSIAKRLAEMHGGEIEARSAGPDQGSEFIVRLPMWAALASELSARLESVAPLQAIDPLRVLVADDNADAATSLATILEMSGHAVRTAQDGAEALRIAAMFEPDVALLDIGMPQLDGYEVCRRLRARESGSGMLIIALSGWGQSEDKRRSLEAGFDEHLVKPADVRTLEQALARMRRASVSPTQDAQ